MNKKAERNVTLGIFVTLGVFIFVAVIYYLGSQQSLFGSRIEISALFKSISGLQPGNNVRFSGLNIGTVREVEIANDSMVRVTLVIDKSASKFIRKDAVATIDSDGLMGNKIVSISPGVSGEYIEDGDTIRTKEPVNIDDVIASFKETSDNTFELVRNLTVISDRIREGEGLLGRIVSDSILVRRVENIMMTLEESGHNISEITREVGRAAYALNHGDGLVTRAIYDEAWAGSVSATMDTISRISKNLSEASRELESFVYRLNHNNGAINKLLNDTSVARNIEATLANLRQGTADLDEVMETINESWLLNIFSGEEKKSGKKKKRSQQKASKSDE